MADELEVVETAEAERSEPGELAGVERAPDAAGDTERPSDDAAGERTALLDRLSRLERSNAELNDTLFRMGRDRDGGSAPGRTADAPPVDKVETWEDLQKYLDWRDQRLADSLRGALSGDAAAVASEQRARGLFNREQMGNGRDFDALVARHIEPLERTDPSLRRVFNAQRDPAGARYALAAVLELLERHGGDPAKGFAALWAAVDGRRATTDEVVGKIRKAAERQVGRSQLKGAAAGGEPRTKALDAKHIDGMSVTDFLKAFPNALQ